MVRMSGHVHLDINLLLPYVSDRCSRCTERLRERIGEMDGVHQVEMVRYQDSGTAQLAIHYDRNRISFEHIQQTARKAGAELSQRYAHLMEQVRGIRHESRAEVVRKYLAGLDGVLEVQTTSAGLVKVEYDPEKLDRDSILQRLAEMDVHPVAEDQKKHRDVPSSVWRISGIKELFREHLELVFSLLCGFFLLTGWLLGFADAPLQRFSWPLLLLAYVFGSYYTLLEVTHSLRAGTFNIDLLMLIAATGAAFLGAWAEGALLLFLFSLGHSLEHYAMGRARHAIESLSQVTPDTASVYRDGSLQIVPVGELQIGERILVRPNERIPADGFVANGTSSVDQSPVTGESMPVDKKPAPDPDTIRQQGETANQHFRTFAGSINGSRPLEIEVLSHPDDSTMARMVKLVKEAETQRSPTQRFAVQFERIFVPVILVLVVLLMFAWMVINEPFSDSFYRAITVLVAASPCALAISTPSAILSGVARAARLGVLFKGGQPLENLGQVRAIAFDKTGTLTAGEPRIVDIALCDGIKEQELLATTVAIEQLSSHPLAQALVRDARGRLDGQTIPHARQVESVTGKGIQGMLNGSTVRIGSPDMFTHESGSISLPASLASRVHEFRQNGCTTVLVQKGSSFLGAIALMDTPRANARETMRTLKQLGIARLILISGDHREVAERVAEQIGIDEAWGDLLPEDKVASIRELVRSDTHVAMVGDGVNDAPAMANATVGVAMGAAGSDVALETSDIALMSDDLGQLPRAIRLSRRTRQIIKQNLWISLGMIAFLVPVAILGYANIGIAVLLHEGSTLVVVLNALRLLQDRV